MGQKTIIVVALFLLAVTIYMGARERNLNQDLKALQSRISKSESDRERMRAQVSALQAKLDSKLQKDETERAMQEEVEQHQIVELRRVLSLEEAKLQLMQENLHRLKDRGGPVSDSALGSRLKADSETISQLEAQLREMKTTNHDVDVDRQQALVNTHSQLQYDEEKLHQAIRGQEDIIKQTQSQISDWRGRKRDVNRPTKLDELTTDLKTQQAQLGLLKQQQISLHQDQARATGLIRLDADEQKQQIKDNEARLQDRIKRTHLEMDDLQRQLSSAKGQQGNWQQEVGQLQKQISDETSKVQTLATELKLHATQFDLLKKQDSPSR